MSKKPLNLRQYFSVRSGGDVGIEFPNPKPSIPAQTFEPGDRVIVTTACEDIELHELTGVVTLKSRTGAYHVKMDVDGSILPLLPHEIGHRH